MDDYREAVGVLLRSAFDGSWYIGTMEELENRRAIIVPVEDLKDKRQYPDDVTALIVVEKREEEK
jgi:hypothetical protein